MTLYNESSLPKLQATYGAKTREEKRAGGRIENWKLVEFNDISPFKGEEGRIVVVGTLHEDPYWGYTPGEPGPIRTSLIVSINDDQTELETMNTVYQLGAPHKE